MDEFEHDGGAPDRDKRARVARLRLVAASDETMHQNCPIVESALTSGSGIETEQCRCIPISMSRT